MNKKDRIYLAVLPVRKESWKAIILCVITAFTFWAFNALNKNYTTNINYPIRIDYDPDSLMIVNAFPKELSINVSGGGWQLLRRTLPFNQSPITISLDNPIETKFLTSGFIKLFVQEAMSDLDINYIHKDTLLVDLQPIIEKQILLDIDSTSIDMDEYYEIFSAVEINPDTAILRGPKSILDTIASPLVIKPRFRKVDGNINRFISLSTHLPQPYVSATPDNYKVSFKVVEYEQMGFVLDIGKVNFPKDSSIWIDKDEVDATFLVQSGFAKKVEKYDFTIIADFETINYKDSTVNVEVMYVPDYVKNLKLEVEKVRVYGRKK